MFLAVSSRVAPSSSAGQQPTPGVGGCGRSPQPAATVALHTWGLKSRRFPSRCCTVRPSALLRREIGLGAAIFAVVGTKDPTTIVNALLSGYGLPMLPQGSEFATYDEFEDDFTFEFPKKWVSRPNSMRKGVYVSDFNTADKVTVDVIPAPSESDLVTTAVATIVSPRKDQQDDRLEMPNPRMIKAQESEGPDGKRYLYLEFPSSTITRSGYSIKRRNFAAVAVEPSRGEAVVLNASARSDQFNDQKRDLLQRIVSSFRVRP
eukprot:CAMPEP_0117654350 /NCGR_PEP_ID=MMETSP0804-20121206/3697_1 /TAXON_ID=1074897 /ORGANISM="Tetraselmis astigmatica, Strain CCMP880" /LENGTH=261 /DNA_ID=CAMNT_0005460625 /DNA_START=28 /DNA_END=813 /DNA_ORIENTATION=-